MDPIMIETNFSPEEERVILHVLVIGFHHKKGSQVDYCYPPLVSACYCNPPLVGTCYCSSHQITSTPVTSAESGSGALEEHRDRGSDDGDLLLPEEWKAVPSLSLPDGAHNFSSDSVFFHLPMVSKCPLHGQIQTTKYSNHQTTQDPKYSNHQTTQDQITQDQKTVYGVSCYRQVVASDSIRESDSSITRTTVMKAVVVLSRLPFYGLICAKTDSITRVYFSQNNFSNRSCLTELYNNLNFILSRQQRESLSPTEARLFSLSPTKYLFLPFTHRVLLLFKLLLLEKKILFFSTTPITHSSVGGGKRSPLVGGRKAIKTPTTQTAPKTTPMAPKTTQTAPKVTEDGVVKEGGVSREGSEDAAKDKSMATSIEPEEDKSTATSIKPEEDNTMATSIKPEDSSPSSSVRSLCLSLLTLSSLVPEVLEPSGRQYHLYCTHCQETDPVLNYPNASSDCQSVRGLDPVIAVTGKSGSLPTTDPSGSGSREDPSGSGSREDPSGSGSKDSQTSETEIPAHTHSSTSPLLPPLPPFQLFHHVHLHPYLDLSFIDTVSSFDSCLIGATNGLYKQKKTSLFDVTVDVVTGRIDFENNHHDWKRAATLTNEDLRFADFLCKHTTPGGAGSSSKSGTKGGAGLNGDSCDTWEGSDDWIRIQINLYLLHMLKTVLLSEYTDNARDLTMFGASFVKLWKECNNYKSFKERFFSEIAERSPEGNERLSEVELITARFGAIKSGHPFGRPSHTNQVTSAMADLKLRFAASGYASTLFGAKNSPSGSSASTEKSGTVSEVHSVKSAISIAKSSLATWYTSYTVPSIIGANFEASDRLASDQLASDQSASVEECVDSDLTPEKTLRKDFQSVSLSKLLKSRDANYEVASDAMDELMKGEDEEIFTRPDAKGGKI